MKKYFDKHGKEIKAGMIIRHSEDGVIEKVYACGDGDLGVDAVNPEYRKKHPDAEDEFYSLSSIGVRDFEIINNIKSWNVTYKHPFTGKEIKAIVYGETKKQAVKQARANNVPTKGESFYWEIVSIEETKE